MRYEATQFADVPAAEAPDAVRAEFIKKTYAHLGGAVLLFVVLEALLLKSSFGQQLAVSMLRGSWLLVLGGFMLVGWLAQSWARSARSSSMQYLGLGLYVVAEAIVFLPLLLIAVNFSDPTVLPQAAITTGIIFGGLTATVFITRKDFSFLGHVLGVVAFGGLAAIIGSLLFGFTLGTFFSVVMVMMAAGYILYYTSNVLHHYPIGSHVAAALALFSAVALLFWYVLRILLSSRR